MCREKGWRVADERMSLHLICKNCPLNSYVVFPIEKMMKGVVNLQAKQEEIKKKE